MATKTIEVCDDCEEESEELKKCSECHKVFCSDCQSEHIENDHFNFEDYYDEHKDEFWSDV